MRGLRETRRRMEEKNSTKNVKQEEEEEMEVLKTRISTHPLYHLLLHSHLNILKVCSGEESPEIETSDAITLMNKVTLSPPDSSHQESQELDLFMGAYCSTLRELKEAMEKPLQETHRFVDSMYSQLNDVVPSSP